MSRLNIRLAAMAAAAALLLLLCGCRKENTEVVTIGMYATEQNVKTYSEIWDLLWRGMNQNYVGWEIEDFDWDEILKIYTPQFEALDEKVDSLNKADSPDEGAHKETADDAEKLFHEVFDRFHDGHLYVEYVDYATGKRRGLSPSSARNSGRTDLEDAVRLSKSYYCKDGGEFSEDFRLISVSSIMCEEILKKQEVMLEDYERLSSLEEITDSQQLTLNALENALPILETMRRYMEKSPFYSSSLYALYRDKLSEADIVLLELEYGFPDTHFDDDETAALLIGTTKDNIIYYRLTRFALPRFETLEVPASSLSAADSLIYRTYYDALAQLHDKAYEMYSAGTLKGIILDVRNNPGGLIDDLKWMAGLFYKGERYEAGTMKMKNGLGRLDYTVPLPVRMDCYGSDEEDIDEPMVILTNAQSVSCAEFTTATVKQHPNGISLGMRTWGGGNKLLPDATYNSVVNYSGCIGKMGETPVFVYIPYDLTSFYDIGVIDGVGIAPDIEIRYDADLYSATGRDNQFERALSYIREGK
ncbi:MAG: S41 family peptidase [Bacteroidia bacterium]|nr:S41 family peptidase [Bacteroidia bacterium]